MLKIRRIFRGWLAERFCQHPRVGIGVIVLHEGHILLGVRSGKKIGVGKWQCAGGHLEYMETPEDCAIRELLEETALHGKNARIVRVTNNPYKAENRHYITIWLAVDVEDISTLENPEPDKCERWEWFPVDSLPTPLFQPSGVLSTEHLREIIKLQSRVLQPNT